MRGKDMRFTDNFSEKQQLEAELLYEIDRFSKIYEEECRNSGMSEEEVDLAVKEKVDETYNRYKSMSIDLENIIVLFRELNANQENDTLKR